jgi:FMN phosphatase YigB (HAD superfamily)
MNVAFDLDSTLVDLEEPIENICRKMNFKYEPARDWNFSNYPENVKQEIFKMFKDPAVMCNLKPYPKSVELIELLKKHNKVIIITSRVMIEETKEFVKNLFNVPCFVVDMGKSKLKILKKEKIDIWADDCPNELLKYQKFVECIMISNSNTIYNHYLRNEIYNIESVEYLFNNTWIFNVLYSLHQKY